MEQVGKYLGIQYMLILHTEKGRALSKENNNRADDVETSPYEV